MTDRLLLDTCAVIWLATGSDSLSTVARLAVEEASEVFVSPVSAWEIALKYNNGKLQLPCEPEKWFDHALEVLDLKLMPSNHHTAMRSTNLPKHHNDPCDRMIIQTAMDYGLTVVTGDKRFHEYGVEVIC